MSVKISRRGEFTRPAFTITKNPEDYNSAYIYLTPNYADPLEGLNQPGAFYLEIKGDDSDKEEVYLGLSDEQMEEFFLAWQLSRAWYNGDY